jgi:hypothetical protein
LKTLYLFLPAVLLLCFGCDHNNNGKPDWEEKNKTEKSQKSFDRSTPGSSAGTLTDDNRSVNDSSATSGHDAAPSASNSYSTAGSGKNGSPAAIGAGGNSGAESQQGKGNGANGNAGNRDSIH